MRWQQLHIDTTSQQASSIEELLSMHGAMSVTLQDNKDQPILEPGVGETPIWHSTRITGLFSNTLDLSELIQRLKIEFIIPAPAIIHEKLEDRDWEREWLDHFKPLQCGEKLWICPGWQTPPNPHAINVMLDPGLAFGTGTHETTRLCLQWLDTANVIEKHVVDFGCGSGILGIAALMLGASHVVFVDNDPQALAATLANLNKNNINQHKFQIIEASKYHSLTTSMQSKSDHTLCFDLVLANILAQPLIELASQLIDALKPKGRIVLSGLQNNQQTMVENAYTHAIDFTQPASKNEWLRLNGKLKTP